MAERGYLLGERAAAAVRDLTARRDGTPAGDPARVHGPVPGIVRVTSDTATDGWYPAKWQDVTSTGLLADGGDAWVRGPGDPELIVGYYPALRTGVDAAGVSRWQTVPGDAVAIGLEVQVSPTPPLHVSTSGGVATVSIDAASTTLPGYVTTGTQTFNGDKGTQGGWSAIDTVNVSGEVFHSVGQGSGAADFWHLEEPPGTDNMPYEQAAVVGAIKGASDRGYLSVSAGGICGIAGETDLGLSQAKYSVRDGSTWKHGIYTTRTVQGAGVDAGLRITWEFAGGILVRETVAAGPSGSGSGTATDLDCCPGVALPNTLTMTFPDTTTDTLTFNGGNSWIGNVSGAMVGCYDLGSGIQWYLIYGGLTLPADGGGSCDPFSQTFTDGTDVYEVTE